MGSKIRDIKNAKGVSGFDYSQISSKFFDKTPSGIWSNRAFVLVCRVYNLFLSHNSETLWPINRRQTAASAWRIADNRWNSAHRHGASWRDARKGLS